MLSERFRIFPKKIIYKENCGIVKKDHVYQQHNSVRANRNQHESDRNQHKSDTSQHETI